MKTNRNNELIFGLVAPLGVELDFASGVIEKVLRGCGYEPFLVSLSKFLNSRLSIFSGEIPSALDDYIEKHQSAGNNLRKETKRNDAMAMGALLQINELRKQFRSSNATSTRLAFIIRQFKTPEEVALLRRIYGNRFILISIYAKKDERITWLSKAIARSRENSELAYTKFEDDAKRLIDIDDAESEDFGQKVRDTFPKADFFARWPGKIEEKNSSSGSSFENQFLRFIQLLLGNPDCPPTNEEFLMFQALAVSLRSADWSRQVGAVIASREGSVIAVGRNDDPKVGGGVMASDKDDEDPAKKFKWETVREIVDKLGDWLRPEIVSLESVKLTDQAMTKLRSTRLMGFGEFGRMVHAEMAAITDAALRGVSVKGTIMFCTTFPCQNCAKHLMAAGIRALVHIDPYPKSLVLDMYPDEVEQHPMSPLNSKELLTLFDREKQKFYLFNYLGVAPRRYEQLFKMPIRRDSEGNKPNWISTEAEPRIYSEMVTDEYFKWEIEEAEALRPYLLSENV